MYEKTFSPSFMIPVEDGSGREITLLALIGECGYLKGLSKEEIDNVKTIEVEWYYDTDHLHNMDEVQVHSFGINGNVIREYNDVPENRMWGENDEILVSSLLMWGELDVE